MLKISVSLILLIFVIFSTEAKFYSMVVKEYQLSGMECKMVVYNIFSDNNNFDPIDDMLIGTYSAIIGKCTDDPKSGTIKAEVAPANKKSGIYVVTSVLNLQSSSDGAITNNEMIPSSCHLVTTTFYDDNGTPIVMKDDLKLGSHHVSIKKVDGVFSDNKGICESFEKRGINLEFITNGLHYEIITDDPEYEKKINEFLRSVSH